MYSSTAMLYHHQTWIWASWAPKIGAFQFQCPSYVMPYPMYSPVPEMPVQNAAFESFFMQPQYAPYGELEVQLNSVAPSTTLAPSHRNQMETFTDNQFAPKQQQRSGNFALNQGNAATALQHGQSGQQHRGQNETNAMFGGGGQIAPSSRFGMPSAVVQSSFMPQANRQSLSQAPVYYPQMSYQQQSMMPGTSRMSNSNSAQTWRPAGNNGQQQRRPDGTEWQGYGGGGGPGSVDHSAGGGAGTSAAAQSYYTQKFNSRQYK